MRKLPLILVWFVLCLPLFCYSDNGTDYYDYSFARMSYVTGDVFVERASDMGYEQGIVNLPIVENDKLGSREGRAEIHFGKKNYLRIDRFTHVDFASLPRKGNDQIKLNLLSGSIYLRVSFLGREKDFEVHTPDASFYVLEEGLYGIKVVENSETEIHVVEGAVEAAGEEGSVLVESENRLVASNGAFLSGPEILYASYQDSFFEWNNERDDLHFRLVKKTYLPAELYEYESELSASGRWVYETSYGYVWVPHVYHHTWRPYYYGRWMWYPVCGWTWVPYASWGWCVSHYGRWHWRFGLGWYWIPTCSWGPAWVHWHCGYDYYGWCPVSYWGYPVVVQNNYFYGRWNDRYYPLNSRALTVIHKNQLQAPRISKVALSRSQTNRLGKISLAASQPKIKGTPLRNSLTSQKASQVLARSNVRKVGKSFSSSPALRSTSRSPSSKITGNTISKRTTAIPSGRSGLTKNPVSRLSSRNSSSTLSSKSASRLSSGAKDPASPEQKRARISIKSYPSRVLNGTRSISSGEAVRPSRTRATYPSRESIKESSKSGSRALKQYPSRSSYTSRRSSPGESQSSAYTPRTSSKSKSSYRSTSRYGYPTRSSYSSERSTPSSSYRSSPSYRTSPSRMPSSSYRSSSSTYKSSSAYKSSSRSTSRGVVSPRSSSSSSRGAKSYTKSSRSSSSFRSSSSKSSSRSSSPSRGGTSSGSKSSRSVSKSSSRAKGK